MATQLSKLEADAELLWQHLKAGTLQTDPQLIKRIRERSDNATAEAREKHGVVEIAVDLVRELRDVS